MEEFEDKIDKIAGGVEEANGETWIGKLYNKFKGSFLGDDDNSLDNMDGLEPPILDETWGLDDVRKLYPDDKSESD